MSLRSMAVMRAEAESVAERDVGARGAEAPPSPGLKDARDQLVALIPAEAIALFILLIGLTSEETVGVRSLMLGVVVVFALGWITLSYWEAKGGRKGAGWPGWEMAIGVIAFLAWSTSVPASPFSELDPPTWVGPVIVAATSALIAFLARLRTVWAKSASPTPPRPSPPPAAASPPAARG